MEACDIENFNVFKNNTKRCLCRLYHSIPARSWNTGQIRWGRRGGDWSSSWGKGFTIPSWGGVQIFLAAHTGRRQNATLSLAASSTARAAIWRGLLRTGKITRSNYTKLCSIKTTGARVTFFFLTWQALCDSEKNLMWHHFEIQNSNQDDHPMSAYAPWAGLLVHLET